MKLSTSIKKNHEALWNWLAENSDKQKRDWPVFIERNNKKLTIPHNHCFLCHSKKYGCSYKKDRVKPICPLFDCMTPGIGLYSRWSRSTNTTERIALAKQIANCFKKDKPFKEVKL